MMLVLRLAHRNIFRNHLRTLVALLAIAAGCAALILNGGIVSNIFGELRENAIKGRHGHLQIYKRGYTDRYRTDPEAFLLDPAETRQILELSRAHPEVENVTRRREFSGLLTKGERRTAFLGIGVDPDRDAEFSSHLTIRTGKLLSAGAPYEVLAGRGLSEKFGGEIGDDLVLMTNTGSGALNALHVRLRGVFEGGLKEYDDWTLKVPLTALDHLLQDDRTEQIVLLLKRTESVKRVRDELQDAFDRAGLDVEMRSWNELALFHNQVVELFGRELGIIRMIIAVLVLLSIGNAIGMSIIERERELAALRAIGLGNQNLALLLLLEALLLGTIGAVLGVGLGVAAAETATAIGIHYPSPPGSTRPFVGGIDVVPATVLEAFLLALGASIVAAVVPIWRTFARSIAPSLRYG
jgi:putative ABC transport system permease protein